MVTFFKLKFLEAEIGQLLISSVAEGMTHQITSLMCELQIITCWRWIMKQEKAATFIFAGSCKSNLTLTCLTFPVRHQ